MTDFYRRIGRFLFVLGAGFLVLFGFSDYAREPRYNLFFWGLIIIIAGIVLIRRNRPEPVDSGRFRVLKNLRKNKK